MASSKNKKPRSVAGTLLTLVLGIGIAVIGAPIAMWIVIALMFAWHGYSNTTKLQGEEAMAAMQAIAFEGIEFPEHASDAEWRRGPWVPVTNDVVHARFRLSPEDARAFEQHVKRAQEAAVLAADDPEDFALETGLLAFPDSWGDPTHGRFRQYCFDQRHRISIDSEFGEVFFYFDPDPVRRSRKAGSSTLPATLPGR